MRKLTTILASLLLALPSVAQQKPHTWSITPKVGITSSKFSKSTEAGYIYIPAIETEGMIIDQEIISTRTNCYFTNSHHQTGFTIGAEAQYQFNKTFGLSFGLFYTQQGVKWNTKGYYNNIGYSPSNSPLYPEMPSDFIATARIDFKDNYKYNYNTLNIPILANFYIWKGLALKAGIEPQIKLSADINAKTTVTNLNSHEYNTVLINYTNSKCRNFNLAAPIGISYEYKNICADIQYHHGITHVMHNGADNITTQLFTFTVGYKL